MSMSIFNYFFICVIYFFTCTLLNQFYPILYDLSRGYRYTDFIAILCHFLDRLKNIQSQQIIETKRPDKGHEAPLQIVDTSPSTALELQQTTTQLKGKMCVFQNLKCKYFLFHLFLNQFFLNVFHKPIHV